MERHEAFDEWLNETSEPYTLGNLTFYPADILAECDPIAYRVTLADWKDSEGIGECDTCGEDYDTSSRDGRCGDCGECAEHCSHTECNCECGCTNPLDGGTCVDCGDGDHQNNNELPEYRRTEQEN